MPLLSQALDVDGRRRAADAFGEKIPYPSPLRGPVDQRETHPVWRGMEIAFHPSPPGGW